MHYYQTPFDIAVTLEQVSNCKILLREQMRIEKVKRMKQNNVISYAIFFNQKHVQQQRNTHMKGTEKIKKTTKGKRRGEKMHVCKRKKCMSKKHTHETYGRKERENKNNNKYEELSDDEVKEEDEECCNVLNDEKSRNFVINSTSLNVNQ